MQYKRIISKSIVNYLEKSNQNNKLITLEGSNGVGKSTILKKIDNTSIQTRISTLDLWRSSEIKSYLIKKGDNLSSAFYFLSAWIESKKEIDTTNKFILIDRSIWSTFAFLYASNSPLFNRFQDTIFSYKELIPFPSHTLIIKCSFAERKKRIFLKGQSEIDLDHTTLSLSFHQREVDFYKSLKRNIPNTFIIETNYLTINETIVKIEKILNKIIDC